MFAESTLNPHYFANPPAFTYLLHFLFRLWYGSAAGGVCGRSRCTRKASTRSPA